VSCRFEGGGGQRIAQVRLVEPDDVETRGRRVVAQPSERDLVGRGQQDQRVRDQVPPADDAGMSDREIERCVCRLTRLGPGGQVITGNQV
jgi:hypothetical protein